MLLANNDRHNDINVIVVFTYSFKRKKEEEILEPNIILNKMD